MKKIFSFLILYNALMSQAMAGNLTVHEWGTFTSFMGSHGELVEGLHHEDEALPSFVYGLKKEEETRRPTPTPTPPSPHCRPNSKVGCFTMENLIKSNSELFPEAPLSSGITQKMETPVIYFYGDAGKKVNVDISFPQGIITQYYPQASYAYPKLQDAKELKDSHFIFDVTLLTPKTQGFPATNKESIWNPARQVPAANVIQSGNGNIEKFIFYRGVGNFASPLKVSSDNSDTLTLENLSDSPISMAIILNSNGTRGNIKVLENINTKVKVLAPDLSKAMAFDQYILKTKEVIVAALIRNGLFKDEAVAMVNTWEKSYFHTPGLRVLYVVPNGDTESILHLSVKPTPNELKRVLIGRIEIMTKNEEAYYLMYIDEQAETIKPEAIFGRFYEPKLRRLEQIATGSLKEKIRQLL